MAGKGPLAGKLFPVRLQSKAVLSEEGRVPLLQQLFLNLERPFSVCRQPVRCLQQIVQTGAFRPDFRDAFPSRQTSGGLGKPLPVRRKVPEAPAKQVGYPAAGVQGVPSRLAEFVHYLWKLVPQLLGVLGTVDPLEGVAVGVVHCRGSLHKATDHLLLPFQRPLPDAGRLLPAKADGVPGGGALFIAADDFVQGEPAGLYPSDALQLAVQLLLQGAELVSPEALRCRDGGNRGGKGGTGRFL